MLKESAETLRRELRITEIFYSIQGESIFVGQPTIFIRLTGCPLRCGYCDTAYAFSKGKILTFDHIFKEIKKYSTPYITVTGGEPLAQPECLTLLQALCDDGYIVALETSGALNIQNVDVRVTKIMDLKTPGSNEQHKNLWSNIDYLRKNDHIKFVICNREDFDWAKNKINEYQLSSKCQVWFSPSFHDLVPGTLADWILEEQLPVRLQIQLHKVLWGDVVGR